MKNALSLEWNWEEEAYNESTGNYEFQNRFTTVFYDFQKSESFYNRDINFFEPADISIDIFGSEGDELTDSELDRVYEEIMESLN